MTDTSAPRPFFEIRDLSLRPVPALLGILATPVIMQAVLLAGREPARWLWKQGPEDWAARSWIFIALALLLQAVVGLAAIGAFKLAFPKLDAHLRWPQKGRSLAGLALLIGIGMGVIMLVGDFWSQLLSRTPIDDFPVDPIDSPGWLFAMSITGLAEETIFRGLIVGLLVLAIPGRVRIGPVDLPLAAYIASLLFGLAHYDTFFNSPLHLAIAQQIYAFIWGLVYVWLMEKSDSLLAPTIAHGAGNAVEVGLAMAFTATLTWRAQSWKPTRRGSSRTRPSGRSARPARRPDVRARTDSARHRRSSRPAGSA